MGPADEGAYEAGRSGTAPAGRARPVGRVPGGACGTARAVGTVPGVPRRRFRPAVSAALCVLTLAAAAALGRPEARADGALASLVGRAAPPIRARPLDSDEELGLDRYRGRVVLLAFVATWCAACRRIAPELDALATRHRERGLEVLALSHEPRARIRAHVAARPRRHPVLQCTGRTAVRYGADALPTLVLVDRQGVVRAAHQGASGEVVARLRASLESLL